MELVKHVLKVKNGQEIYVSPICDLQYTGPGGAFADGMFKSYIAEARARDAFYVGLGDYVDMMSPSNREKFEKAGMYDTTKDFVLSKIAETVDELYAEYLIGTTGKWLGLVHGHHWAPVTREENTDQRLARHLRTQYLGTSAIIRLDFVSDDSSERRGSVTLWLHHGRGNGKAAAPINALQNVASSWDADVYMIGHMTKLASAAINRVYPVDGADGALSLAHRKQLLVGCGGWSKAYMAGHKADGAPGGCYVEQAMLSPTALGGTFIKIQPKWDSRRWEPSIRVEI